MTASDIPTVNCVWDAWAEWDDCEEITDASVIGRGSQTRKRMVLIGESNGGEACIGDEEESRFCFCEATDCAWSKWGEWGHCNGPTCMQVRSRTIETLPTCGGAECGDITEEERSCTDLAEGEECCINENCEESLLCDGNRKICRVTCYPTDARPPGNDPKWNFCGIEPNKWLCQEGEGDCDNDDHCEGDLICAFEMCPNTKQLRTGPDVDCCGQGPASVAVTATDLIEVFSDTHVRK